MIQPVKSLFEAVRAKAAKGDCWEGILLHSDTAQALGKMSVDVGQLGADYINVVGHKVGIVAPEGGSGGWNSTHTGHAAPRIALPQYPPGVAPAPLVYLLQ